MICGGEKTKPVLDATCGSRMIWFNKNNQLAIFCDKRELDNELIYSNEKIKRYINIKPDIIADFTCLPFENDSFWHIVFDPPHLINVGETSWLAKKYGRLNKNAWERILRDGFEECWRVLKPNGTLIFKWCEIDVPVKKIIDVIGHEPLYGNRSGKQSKTHWMAFIKEVEK